MVAFYYINDDHLIKNAKVNKSIELKYDLHFIIHKKANQTRNNVLLLKSCNSLLTHSLNKPFNYPFGVSYTFLVLVKDEFIY